ncbi:MAG: CPBP family intramembrane metalloprotease [Firmicutes bacterium]|jgi:hypothetical protein|nr:CPBP family intramembrane metalloprotease [Bacillota bacterium]
MNTVKRIDNYFRNVSTLKFIIWMVLLSYIVVIPIIPLLSLLESSDMNGPESIKNAHPIIEFIAAVGIAPLIETLIFQTAIFYFLRKIQFFNDRSCLIILVSALAFGMAHTYSILYILFGFLIGLILAYAYHLSYDRPNSPFKIIVCVHALRNFIAFLLLYLNI